MKDKILLFFGVFSFVFSFAQSDPDSATFHSVLFTNDEPLEMVIKTDINALFRDRGDEREYHSAHITYKDNEGKDIEVPLKIKVRGNFRRKGGVCRIPPLRLNFAKLTSTGTIFEGEDKIKLVTHCQKSPAYLQYILQEYLVYRMYNVLSEYSFKVKLVKITYEDESGKWKPMNTYAFMIEDEERMGHRYEGKIKEMVIHPTSTEPYQTTLMSVFAYCVGNTDWSIPGKHNVRLLIREPDDPIVPIPYDFDWCGMVDAPYAVPNPIQFPDVDDVRVRIYRGFKREEALFNQVFETFNNHKEELYALFDNCEGLSKSRIKVSHKYLDEFYTIINTPKLAQRNIISQAR